MPQFNRRGVLLRKVLVLVSSASKKAFDIAQKLQQKRSIKIHFLKSPSKMIMTVTLEDRIFDMMILGLGHL